MAEPLRFRSGVAARGGEEPASETEERLRTVVGAVTAGIVFKGPAGEILDCNPAAARILGITRDPATGAIVTDPRLGALRADGSPLPPEEWPSMVALRTGEPVRDAVIGFTSPGRPQAWVRLTAVPIARPGAAPHAVVVSLEDVTDARAKEAQLRQADRLASLGTLAAGVAHEVNNPLAYVQGNLQHLAAALARHRAGEAGALDDDLDDALREALEGVARVKAIVQGLQQFATPARAAGRSATDLRGQIDAAVSLVRNEVLARARLRVELPESLPPIVAGDREVSQVLVNLLVNAARAIPEGHRTEHEVTLSGSALPDGRLELAVRDTGAGIAAADLPRIFDPFFTTKPFAGRAGLGLSICHGIVTALGGTIAVESAPGRGSTFRVRLPAAPVPVPAAPAPEPTGSRRSRVLVLDDEPLVARTLARAVGGGHEVTTLTSAVEALRRARAGESWDVVLCDLMMPDMTGMEFEAALAEARPELVPRVLYITGGAFTERSQAFLATRPFCEKPIDVADLRAAVAARLRHGTAAAAPPR